jgi:alpha-glucosidase
MTETDWWRGAAIYQIYPRSFFDTDGDGIGDLPGVTAKLEYVAGLGVDAIWLCPFFVSPQADFGYDVADHLAVDPRFGTLPDFDRLLARAHGLGLKVLIDQVFGHTSDRHAWFLDSRADRSNPRADWYVWAEARPDGTPPNNWLAVFGGPAWRWEPRRRQYCLHHFLPSQPALNLHNPDVADAALAGGEFWLRRGVDGFRLDALDFLFHDRALRANPPAPPPPDGVMPAKLFGRQRHLHDMMQPETAAFLARIRRLLDRYPGTAALGELSSQPGSFARLRNATAGERHLHMAYTLAPLRSGFSHALVSELIAEAATAEGWPCWSFSNHDVERAASRWHPRGRAAGHDPDFARLLMALLLSLRGSVCIYQGEELGLTEADLAEQDLRDPFGMAYFPVFRGRDGSRTPLPWNAVAPNCGFSAGRPWLPVPEAHRALAAEGSALAEHWRRFLAWRRATPAMQRGRLIPLALPAPLAGFVRELGETRILCLFNLGEEPAIAPTADLALGEPLRAPGLAAAWTGSDVTLPRFGAAFATLQPALVPA